jgi:hypothetical protein
MSWIKTLATKWQLYSSTKYTRTQTTPHDRQQISRFDRRQCPFTSSTCLFSAQKTEKLNHRGNSHGHSWSTASIDGAHVVEIDDGDDVISAAVVEDAIGCDDDTIGIDCVAGASIGDCSRDGVLSNIPTEDLVDLRRQCVEYMETLRHYEGGNFQVPRERYLQFIVEENRLLNAITNYGEVAVSNIAPDDSNTPSTCIVKDLVSPCKNISISP